jgi:NAD(P)-dependent dehydrogenase (short-subunit alcohol dehydrogenase family)
MSDALFDVSGRVVVVTGGLGQLGRAYVRAFAQRGAHVAVWDVRQPDNAFIQQHFSGLDVRFYAVDITQRATLEAALTELQAVWGTPHVLINNAALDSPPNAPAEETGPFETYPEASWDAVIDVNLKGTFLCCQVVGGAMSTAGRGSIINVSSIYGLVSPNQSIYTYRAQDSGQPFFKPVAYSASKSGIFNLTRYLATYWAKQGVRVNTVTLAGVFNQQDARFLANYTALMPLGRMANVEEYNGVMIFLASDASSYMTGANVVVDGGWTAW